MVEVAGGCCSSSQWGAELGEYWAGNSSRAEEMFGAFNPPLLAAAGIKPGDRVIDIGCGSGFTAQGAAALARPGQVLGIDISAAELGVAREQAAAAGVENLSFVQADAQRYRFERHSADVAISRFGTMFFDDPLAAFTNIGRALRPGGRLAFVCWRKFRGKGPVGLPLFLLATLAPAAMLDGAPAGPYSLADPVATKRLLGSAGFDDVRLAAVGAPLLLGRSVGEVMAFYLAQPAVKSCICSLSPAEETMLPELLGVLRSSLERQQRPGGVAIEAPAWLVTARRSAAP